MSVNGTINAESDARNYEHLAKNPEKMKERFFSGITRWADGKHFEDIGSYDAIVSGLAKAEVRSIHLGTQVDEESNSFSVQNEPVEDRKALVNQRTGKVASIVSDSYTKVNHQKVMRPLSQAMKHLETSTWGSVREFKGGNQVSAAVMTNEAFQIKGDSSYHVGVVLENSYDRSSGIKMQPFVLRGVCANGCLWNAGDIVEPLSRKHVGDAEDEIAGKYREFMQEVVEASPKIQDRLQEAREETFYQVDIYRALRNVGIPKSKVDEILQRPSVRGQSEVSRKALYDAVTRYISRLDENDTSMAHTTEKRYQSYANGLLVKEKEKLTRELDSEQEELQEIEAIQ